MLPFVLREWLILGAVLGGCGAPSSTSSLGLDTRPANEDCVAPPRDALPARLSATGCVDPADPKTALPALVDFNIGMPLWADGAGKHRLFAIPDGTHIDVAADGDLIFPIGALLMKTFFRDGDALETRMLVRHADGEWAGYAYAWNDDQSDAVLLNDAMELDVGWRIPSRDDCFTCHTAAAGFTLGPEVAQLNRDQAYIQSGRTANQLDTLAEVGMLRGLAGAAADLPSFPRVIDADAPDDAWARAYLHSNCAQCHRPDGPEDAGGDLRWETSLLDTGMCDAPPMFGDLLVDDARQIAPGEPARSLLTLRMRDLGEERMPSLGTREVHDHALVRLERWIAALSTCDSPTQSR